MRSQGDASDCARARAHPGPHPPARPAASPDGKPGPRGPGRLPAAVPARAAQCRRAPLSIKFLRAGSGSGESPWRRRRPGRCSGGGCWVSCLAGPGWPRSWGACPTASAGTGTAGAGGERGGGVARGRPRPSARPAARPRRRSEARGSPRPGPPPRLPRRPPRGPGPLSPARASVRGGQPAAGRVHVRGGLVCALREGGVTVWSRDPVRARRGLFLEQARPRGEPAA